MKTLKLIMFALVLLLFNAFSCCKDDEETLPPETQEGKNTFGCLVDGKVWISTNKTSWANPTLYATYYPKDILTIYSTNTSLGNEQHIKIRIYGEVNEGKYQIDSRNTGELIITEESCKGCMYLTDSLSYTGSLILTKLDTITKIISGSFSFKLRFTNAYSTNCICDSSVIDVTEGRFDIKYIP